MQEKMRAIVFDRGLSFKDDHPVPVPGPGDALVRVTVAGVCATDIEITRGYMGFAGVLGHEFTGVVEYAQDASLVGKRVTAEINNPCNRCEVCARGLKRHCPNRTVTGILGRDGAFADRIIVPEANLHVVPDALPDEEAVFIEPLAAAFEITEQVDVGPGKHVCVLGDGRLGLLISQVLAGTNCDLTAVGRHADKLAILDGRGISTTTSVEGLERSFDVVVDATGSPAGFDSALDLVRPTGTVVLKTTVASRTGDALNRVVIDEITVVGSRCGPFEPAIRALEECRVDVRPLVSRVFAIEDGVAAMEYASRKGVLKVLIGMG